MDGGRYGRGRPFGQHARSEVRERVPVDCGGRLYVLGARGVSVLESPDGEELDMEWESVPAEWPVGGAASVGVCLRSDAADVSVAVWSHGSFQPATQARPACLGRWDIRGGFNGTAHGSLMLPCREDPAHAFAERRLPGLAP